MSAIQQWSIKAQEYCRTYLYNVHSDNALDFLGRDGFGEHKGNISRATSWKGVHLEGALREETREDERGKGAEKTEKGECRNR